MTIKHDNGYGTTYVFEVVGKIPRSEEHTSELQSPS